MLSVGVAEVLLPALEVLKLKLIPPVAASYMCKLVSRALELDSTTVGACQKH